MQYFFHHLFSSRIGFWFGDQFMDFQFCENNINSFFSIHILNMERM